MCEDCNQFWHVNNPIRQSHKVLMIEDCEDSINVADDINSSSSVPASVHDSGFHDFDEPEDEISGSQDLEDMCRVATLAETFGLTSFKPFQNTIIDGCLKGKDTIVVQPTGNGKSLCFQFPAVYTGKMSLVITPTISLMRDETNQLNQKGIAATFLGSAQPDKSLEGTVFFGNADIKVLFVTPEWLFPTNKLALVKDMSESGKLGLIAIDEAHLVFDWNIFCESMVNW